MKRLLSKIVSGFSLGITLLMIAYLGIYYVAGQEDFNLLIYKLTDVNVFQSQLLAVGFAGVMMSFAVYILETTLEEDDKSLSMVIVSILALIASLVITMLLIQNLGKFDEIMVDMLIIVGVIVLLTFGLFKCLKESIDELILNKRIKEKNS